MVASSMLALGSTNFITFIFHVVVIYSALPLVGILLAKILLSRHFLLYIIYYSFGFSHCTSIFTLMNCAEKHLCEPKAVSSFCQQVMFFSIISFLTPHREFKEYESSVFC